MIEQETDSNGNQIIRPTKYSPPGQAGLVESNLPSITVLINPDITECVVLNSNWRGLIQG